VDRHGLPGRGTARELNVYDPRRYGDHDGSRYVKSCGMGD